MSVLVIGATGTIGTQIIQRLAASDAEVKALVRTPGKTKLPSGVTEVIGDLTSVASMRAALAGVRTLYLLNAVVADEVTQGMIAVHLAMEAGIERLVYQSVIHADRWTDVPHFAGKLAVERMIEAQGLAATILRPAYFMQNDLGMRRVIEGHGVYPLPIGMAGVHMVDIRDIADIAVRELLARHHAATPLPGRTLDVVGPEAITAESAARAWGDALGREIRVGGADLAAFEQQMSAHGPDWKAYDLRLMFARTMREGMHPASGAIRVLESMLGRPLRRYGDLVREAVGSAV